MGVGIPSSKASAFFVPERWAQEPRQAKAEKFLGSPELCKARICLPDAPSPSTRIELSVYGNPKQQTPGGPEIIHVVEFFVVVFIEVYLTYNVALISSV